MSPSPRPSLKTVEPVAWRGELPGRLALIDQRRLPGELVWLELTTVQEAWDAIKTLAVRGAPAIGVAAAYGVVLGAQAARAGAAADVAAAALTAAEHLATSRPTAVNLFWALERMRRRAHPSAEGAAGADSRGDRHSGAALCAALLAEARAIQAEDLAACRAMGAHGAALLPDGARVLTHCNAGALATAGHGTAVGCIYSAVQAGKRISVLSCETRPLLQGARLTSWELSAAGVPVRVITDGMGAFAMQRGMVDAVVVGADRIARNGDVANKIGTYAHAVAARRHGIPFYVAAPVSTFDLSIADGSGIPIEEREGAEVTGFQGLRSAPEGVGAWNPAFDVTPAELITAIVTERGVIQPVDEQHVLAIAARP